VNFDKICRLALELAYVRKLKLDDLVVVTSGDHDADIDGETGDREYWKGSYSSMTEAYAKRVDFGGPLAGLASLCDLLAQNHGKVPGIAGGFLYNPGMIPNYARNVAVLPRRASEVVRRIAEEVVDALLRKDGWRTFASAAGEGWDELDAAFADAERAVFDKARIIARDLEAGRCADGEAFSLAKWSGQRRPQGIVLRTRNANLMKHMWKLLRKPDFQVAVAVLRNPDTGRLAVLSSNQHRVDIGPVVKALSERFPKTEFDVNKECGRIIWDPRTGSEDPTAEAVCEILAAHLVPRTDQQPKPQAQKLALGVTLGDKLASPYRQNKRR
jgi:hypothetical protein